MRAQGAALRAGFVVAGMVGEVDMATLLAGKGSPAQCRRTAASDRPDGAMLLRRERRSCFAQLRDKTAQRLAVLGGLAVACALAGALSAWRWQVMAASTPPFLQATLAELARDHAALTDRGAT